MNKEEILEEIADEGISIEQITFEQLMRLEK